MKFYLDSAVLEQISQINQYLPLEGLLLEPSQLAAEETEPQQALAAMAEALSDRQHILVPTVSEGFRSVLGEARKIHELNPRFLPMISAAPQGYMAMKACSTLKVPVAACNITSLEQAVFAYANKAEILVVSMKDCSGICDGTELLQQICSSPALQKAKVIACGFENATQLRKAMLLNLDGIAMDYEMAQKVLFNPQTSRLQHDKMELWAKTYSRMELFE